MCNEIAIFMGIISTYNYILTANVQHHWIQVDAKTYGDIGQLSIHKLSIHSLMNPCMMNTVMKYMALFLALDSPTVSSLRSAAP